MKPEIKSKWVAALKSGEYAQGERRVLNDGFGGWCCLGVLCDIYAKEFGDLWERSGEGLRLSIGSCYYPPNEVRKWADFHEDESPVSIGNIERSVAVHNDGVNCPRRTFAEIADAIEAQL